MKTIIAGILGLTFVTCHHSCTGRNEILYVGTYDQRESQGIYVYRFDRNSGTFNLLQTIPEISSPNFLAVHPSGAFLYAVNKIPGEDGRSSDAVSSLAINPDDGTLSLINQVPSHGENACHISLDRDGHWIFISHYGSGSLSVFPVNPEGSIGDSVQTIFFEGSSITSRQESSHFHSILVSISK